MWDSVFNQHLFIRGLATLLEGAGHLFEKQFPNKRNILFFGVLSVLSYIVRLFQARGNIHYNK